MYIYHFWAFVTIWLRHNLKYSRLMLPSWNKGLKNLCVSISKIDDIAYGRGVSFSWFDGRFITEEDTKLCLNSMRIVFLQSAIRVTLFIKRRWTLISDQVWHM